MTKTEQLNELFEEWREAQVQESDSDWKITKPEGTKNIKKHFFCDDGIIDESIYETEHIKVLFLTNEANIEKHISPEQENIGSRIESFNNYFYTGNEPWSSGRMSERICSLFQVIINDYSYPPHKYAKRFAFMNLNKRGGDKDIKTGIHLDKYCDLYSCFILKEIEIINPDIIIWVGSQSFDMDFKDKYLNVTTHDGRYYININNRMVPVIRTWHTSHYRISKSVQPHSHFENKTTAKQSMHLAEMLDFYNLP